MTVGSRQNFCSLLSPAFGQLISPVFLPASGNLATLFHIIVCSFFLSQAEDLVANFFPKKLLELDGFLKVRCMLSSVSSFIFKPHVESDVAGLVLCIFFCISSCYKDTK